ncbi:MAG: proline--tRNA ligase [Deltaproteobacteria bacterium]|nr:proline--tRNA ligase [Deltaproteobacteria bacterium]
MKRSKYLLPTQKNDPAGIEIASHRLMLKAGMIRQLASGIYDMLPIGLKSLRKVENIIREEMNKAGALEVSLPYVQPAELWQETGRWEGNGKELLRFQDRHQRDFCLGPTHEEVITELVRGTVRSYKELPITLYQIQLKFRDEIRPRFGLMRGREFIMKDAYSFSATEESCNDCYQAMKLAYQNIFSRCGLQFQSVEADSGNIGGSASEEFMVLAATGEDAVVTNESGDYAANIEKAQSEEFIAQLPKEKYTSLAKVHTPGAKTIEDVSRQLAIDSKETVKTLIYKADEDFVVVVVPGDRQVNELVLPKVFQAQKVRPATEQEVKKLTDVPFGSLGVIDIDKQVKGISQIVFDTLVHPGRYYCMGANEKDYHWVGAKAGTDFIMQNQAHLHLVAEGDKHVGSNESLTLVRGIEVGHIFKLGTKYSQDMKAMFLDEQGKQQPFIMGCYGIGVGRTLAAAIEQGHDEHGIVLPPQLAPFEVAVVPVKYKDPAQKKVADDLYESLQAQGFDVILDDRDVGMGMKCKDADLIGVAATLIVGPKSIEEGVIEAKLRWQTDKQKVTPNDVSNWLRNGFEQYHAEPSSA